MRTIAVVGGSYAGHAAATALARALPPGHRVLLVDANDFAVHVPYAVRSLVTGAVQSAPLRTETVFGRAGAGVSACGVHAVARARVLAVRAVRAERAECTECAEKQEPEPEQEQEQEQELELELDAAFEGARTVRAAACVLAVGSGGAGKPALGVTLAAHAGAMRASADAVARAHDVTVAGGGPAGVAVAGEITRAHPRKRTTLVHCGQHLGLRRAGAPGQPGEPGAPERDMAGRLFGQLCARGVWVHVNERVSGDGDGDGESARLEHVGTRVAGHVVRCTGARARERTAFLGAGMLDADGRVAVDGAFRTALRGVYAVGDCAGTAGRKTAAQAVREGTACARIVAAHLAGREDAYDPVDDGTIVIPLGPAGAAYPRAVAGYADGSGAGLVDLGALGTWPAPDWYLRWQHRDYGGSAFRAQFRRA